MRKTFISTLLFVFVLSLSSFGAVWNVDAVHSTVSFSVRHLVISNTTGKFKDFEGKVEFDGKDVSGGSVDFTIQVASVDTDDEKRDNHLRSPDFFDVEKHATITFKSKKVIAGEDNKFQIIGDLTIKGITKEVTFNCEFNGSVKTPWGHMAAGFSATTKIDRQEFGVSFNKAMETGGLIVGNEVKINLEIEMTQS